MNARRMWALPATGVALFLCAASVVRASPGEWASTSPGALLDVPYLSQTEELCGGAAVAMVVRYWGGRDVFPQDFQPLVDPQARGIHANALVTAVQQLGWLAIVSQSSTGIEEAAAQISLGRPVVALIQVSDRAYHYVVIVGVTARDVVLHDPARGPFRTQSRADFDRAWAATSRWSLVLLPGSNSLPSQPAPVVRSGAPGAPSRCDALVQNAVDQARDGATTAAEGGFRAAAALCPSSASPWREWAGLKFQQSSWAEARDLALKATARDPSDRRAWEILAASRFLSGDALGALDGWNRIGEPRMDVIDVDGASRTNVPVIARAIGLEPRQMLTTRAFTRAAQRLADLPSTTSTSLRYRPIPGGRVTLQAIVVERDVVPHGWLQIASIAGRSAISRQVRLDVSSPLHFGEVWSGEWRWNSARPRFGATFAVPSPPPLPGVTSIEVFTESQTYAQAGTTGQGNIRKPRRRVAFRVADWGTGSWHWSVGAALDRLQDIDHLAFAAGLSQHLAADHVVLRSRAEWWSVGTDRAPGFWSADLAAAWRSRANTAEAPWSADVGLAFASSASPLALWPGAGTGQGREFLLRAHPLLEAGVIAGPAFGRTIAHSTIEYTHPISPPGLAGLSLAAFVDAARASRLFIDAGVGLRVHVPLWSSAVRLDVARGLQDGRMALSVDWARTWGR